MDELDGDPDREDDDPAGGAADDEGERDEWRDNGVAMALPRYDADQSLGPVNLDEANDAFRRQWEAALKAT